MMVMLPPRIAVDGIKSSRDMSRAMMVDLYQASMHRTRDQYECGDGMRQKNRALDATRNCPRNTDGRRNRDGLMEYAEIKNIL